VGLLGGGCLWGVMWGGLGFGLVVFWMGVCWGGGVCLWGLCVCLLVGGWGVVGFWGGGWGVIVLVVVGGWGVWWLFGGWYVEWG
jgi:hypothetical protein